MIDICNEKDLIIDNKDITSDNDEYIEDYECDENEINEINETNNNDINNDNEDPKFLAECDIIKEREKVISQAQDKLFLERKDSILALIYYEWNIDKLDNWYENIEGNKINSGIILSEEINKKLINDGIKPNGDICLICSEKKNNNFFSLNCGHQFCDECWTEYLKEKIKLPLNALQVKCPQKGCTCIVYEHLYSKYLNNNDIKNLNIAIYKNFINKNDDIKKCPNEKCHLFIKSNNHYAREITCSCGTSFCYKCLNFYHFPCTCDIVQKWCELMKKYNYEYISPDENLSDKWIEANTKECPNCHQKIEKSRGCNYMFCDPKAGGCGHAFCYVCEIDWQKHIDDHFYCNYYNSESVKQKEIKSQKLKEELEIELIEEEFFKQEKESQNEKFFHFFKKYKEYDTSINKCNILKKTLGEKIGLISTIHNIKLFDLMFIINAIEIIINAKNILKMSIIFEYFMKDGIQKDLFENSKEIIEKDIDDLYNKLSNDYLNMLIQTDCYSFFSSIKTFKTSILDLTNRINNCIKSFTEDIENEFILELDDELIKQKN